LVLGLAVAGWCLVGRQRCRPRHVHRRQPTPVRPVDYARDIKPLLAARCTKCHGPSRHKAGLRLDSTAAIRKGSDSGAVIIPKDAGHSLLIAVISGGADVPRMPPSGSPLKPQQIALLKTWINNGAPGADRDEREPAGSHHWAFRSPVRPAVPKARSRAFSSN